MKSAVLVLTVLVVGLARGAIAQSQGPQEPSQVLTDREQAILAAWKAVTEGIRDADYEKALPNLRELSRLVEGDEDKVKVAAIRGEFFDAFQARATIYKATLSLGDLYTNDITETVDFSFYTFGRKNPLLLKVKVDVTNRSGDVVNLLAYAPFLKFERISTSSGTPQAFGYYLVADQYANPGDILQWMVYPGKTQSGEFTYYMRVIESTHDPADFYDSIFGMLLENEKADSFVDLYGAGKASLCMNLDEQTFPIRHLVKAR